MSRPILSLNTVEDQILARIDAALEREREPKRRPKPTPDEPNHVIWLNGHRYVRQSKRESADQHFPDLERWRR